MEEVKKAAETEFDHTSGMAKQEVKQISLLLWHVLHKMLFVDTQALWKSVCSSQIARFQAERVKMLQQALVQCCEKQLITAKENADQFNQHLQAFRGMV